jgi:hypothetical protein
MRDTPFIIATKVCWEHNFFVVVKPIGNHRCKLAISRNGKEKIGEQVYSDKTEKKVKIVEKAGKKYREEILVESYHKKIEALYLDLYKKNFAPMQPKPIIPEELEVEFNYNYQ